jgi:hypothetical protein
MLGTCILLQKWLLIDYKIIYHILQNKKTARDCAIASLGCGCTDQRLSPGQTEPDSLKCYEVRSTCFQYLDNSVTLTEFSEVKGLPLEKLNESQTS